MSSSEMRRAIRIKKLFEGQQGTQTQNRNQYLHMKNFSQLVQASFWATFTTTTTTTTQLNFFGASTFPHTQRG